MSNRKKKTLEAPKAGGNGWIMTYADLMSLLMAFFVMLLAMAEVDKEKFKELGVSMKIALGSPKNTPLHSADQLKLVKDTLATGMTKQSEKADPAEIEKQKMEQKIEETKQDAIKLAEVLKDYIKNEQVKVSTHGRIIVIRLLESGIFKSGEADLEQEFKQVLVKVRLTLKGMAGDIIISGHADDIPIENEKFRSNWELSAGRAYSVIEDLLEGYDIPAKRFVLRGFGSSRPLVPNTNAKNRAKNRRVEIMIDQREPATGENDLKHNATKDERNIPDAPIPKSVEKKRNYLP